MNEITDNPYAPPKAELGLRTPARHTEIGIANVVVGAGMVGAFVTGTGYIALAIAAEQYLIPPWLPGETRLSYGQQFGVTIVAAGLLGAASGISIGLGICRRQIASSAITMVACLITWLSVSERWTNQIADYGSDPSEYVLYWPFVVLIPLAIVLWLATTALMVRRDRVARLSDPNRASGYQF